MSYFLTDSNDGRLYMMSLSEILEMINSDRGPKWQDYDESNWREGLSKFTHFELVGKVGA